MFRFTVFGITLVLSSLACAENCHLPDIIPATEISEAHPCRNLFDQVIQKTLRVTDGTASLLAVGKNPQRALVLTARHVTYKYGYVQTPLSVIATEKVGDLQEITKVPGVRDNFSAQLYTTAFSLGSPLALRTYLTPKVSDPKQLYGIRSYIPLKEDFDAYLTTIPHAIKTSIRVSAPVDGEPVLLIGHPSYFRSGPKQGQVRLKLSAIEEDIEPHLSAISGRILSHQRAAIASAEMWDNEESEPIRYDPAADLYVEALAAPGFSGGGIYNLKGELLGVISIRHFYYDDEGKLVHIVGAVRTSYILDELKKSSLLPLR